MTASIISRPAPVAYVDSYEALQRRITDVLERDENIRIVEWSMKRVTVSVEQGKAWPDFLFYNWHGDIENVRANLQHFLTQCGTELIFEPRKIGEGLSEKRPVEHDVVLAYAHKEHLDQLTMVAYRKFFPLPEGVVIPPPGPDFLPPPQIPPDPP